MIGQRPKNPRGLAEPTGGILERAIVVATNAHAGQTDKQGQPKMLHPLRVMLTVPPEARVVALLHDVMEDAPYARPLESINMDLAEGEREALELLTRDKAEDYTTYIERIAQSGNRLARLVKCADLVDNLRPWPGAPAGLRERYTNALDRLFEALRARGETALLEPEFRRKLARARPETRPPAPRRAPPKSSEGFPPGGCIRR